MKTAGPVKKSSSYFDHDRVTNCRLLTSKCCGEGMIGNSSLLAAVLTVVSVVSLSLLSLLCLRCKKKTKVIHEEHQIYNPQTFQRGGSRFAVTRSKTVTRANQITLTTLDGRNEFPPAEFEEQSEYQNIEDAGYQEDDYVEPLPMSLYENDATKGRTGAADSPSVYANISSSSLKDDEDDYVNSEFLAHEQEDNEPDYVNESGECT